MPVYVLTVLASTLAKGQAGLVGLDRLSCSKVIPLKMSVCLGKFLHSLFQIERDVVGGEGALLPLPELPIASPGAYSLPVRALAGQISVKSVQAANW